jgi:hypothetical protein
MVPELLAADVAELRGLGHTVDVVEDGSRYLIIIRGNKLPAAYNPTQTDVMVMADYQYPQSAMDMFWTCPTVRLTAGTMPQNADQIEEYHGTKWQRWSWHYPGWDPARHNLLTHLAACLDRISREC